MAEVFEAELVGDLGFVRKVALKRMLDSAAADVVAARRFLDEATIASRLHHANVISVVDLGTLDDRPFQVLEFVDGIDAHRLLQRAGGNLPVAVALAIANDVAHALDHAHAAVDSAGLPLGIVHRDVKPSNVLLSWSGDVKLGDFGIAVARDRAAATEAGVVAGTLGFIAPEQRARGTLDGRTDVFALGLTLHALLVGSSPLADIEVEMRALAGEPVPIDPTIPDDVRALLARSLALVLTDRPTAGQLASQIGSALAPRLTGDRRNVLREFLAVHAPVATRPRGALDALLGIEVVMTGSGGEVRRYETRAATPNALSPTALDAPTDPTTARPRDDGSRAGDDSSMGARGDDSSNARDHARDDVATVSRAPATTGELPVRRRRLAPLLAIGGGVALVGIIAAWQIRGESAPPIDAVIADKRDAASPEPVVVAPPDASSRGSAVGPGSSSVDASVNVAPDAKSIAIARDARAPRVADAAVAAVDAALVGTDVALVGTGYIQVLGEDLIGAAVLIDGKHAGSVPNPIAVTVGPHRVEVERKDGTRLPARTVEVTPIHNRANPVRPTW